MTRKINYFNEHLPFSGITFLQAAIEGLSSVGAVTITTASVVNSTAFGGRTGDVVEGSPYVTPSADVSSVLSEGDWLRLCDTTDGLVRKKCGTYLRPDSRKGG